MIHSKNSTPASERRTAMLDVLIKAGNYIAIILLGMFLRKIGFLKKRIFPSSPKS